MARGPPKTLPTRRRVGRREVHCEFEFLDRPLTTPTAALIAGATRRTGPAGDRCRRRCDGSTPSPAGPPRRPGRSLRGRRGSGRCSCWRTASGRGPGSRGIAPFVEDCCVTHGREPLQRGSSGGRSLHHSSHHSPWVPRSTTLPSSRTMISSTWSRRCVMKRVTVALGEGQQVSRQRVGGDGVEVLGRLVEDEDGGLRPATRWRCPPKRHAPAGPTRVASPAGSPVSQSPRPTRASTASGSVVSGPRRHPQVLGRVVAKRCGLCSRGRPPSAPHQERRRSSGTRWSEKRTRTSPRRLSARSDPRAPPGARGEIEVHPAQDRSVPSGVTGPPHRTQEERAIPTLRSGVSGSTTGAGASVVAKTRPAAVRERCSAWVAAGKGATARRRRAGRGPAPPATRRAEVTAVGGVHPERQDGPSGQCGGQADPTIRSRP